MSSPLREVVKWLFRTTRSVHQISRYHLHLMNTVIVIIIFNTMTARDVYRRPSFNIIIIIYLFITPNGST